MTNSWFRNSSYPLGVQDQKPYINGFVTNFLQKDIERASNSIIPEDLKFPRNFHKGKKMIYNQLERQSSLSYPSETPIESSLRRLYSPQEFLLETSIVVLVLACFITISFAARLLKDDVCCSGFVPV